MSKKLLFWFSGIVSIILLVVNYFGTYEICNVEEGGNFLSSFLLSIFKSNCVDFLYHLLISLEIFLPLFLLSAITYKMPDRVYKAWSRFSLVYIPISIILTLLTPDYSQGLVPVDKGRVSLGLSVLFIIISISIIVITSFREGAKQA
ncbi:MAG: hypothetical protein WCK48_00510 [bacterium]